jgi:sodium/potassium-transporting ATPase subunit alpha
MFTGIDTEKEAQPSEHLTSRKEVDNNIAGRTVAFPGDEDVQEEKRVRTKGLEMKREMTQDERDLAAAGYEHLEESKAKKALNQAEVDNVDIHEHQLTFKGIAEEHMTSFDSKDPAQSMGLTSEEAKARLARDGQNVLTPPKKKSALRKVRQLALYFAFPN